MSVVDEQISDLLVLIINAYKYAFDITPLQPTGSQKAGERGENKP